MMIKCANGRNLYIINAFSIDEISDIDSNFSVVLLTPKSIAIDKKKIIIWSLLEFGVREFICFGEMSEILHDEIDDFIDEYDQKNGSEIASETVTTFHDDESVEDVVNYFIYGAGLLNSSKSGMLAIIDTSDRELSSALINS